MDVNPADLALALKDAKAGDVINLADGDYGPLKLSRRAGLTFVGGPGAVFRTLELSSCQEMALEGFGVAWAAMDGEDPKAIVTRIAFCKAVTMRGMTMRGQPVADGLLGSKRPTDEPPPGMNALVSGYYAGKAVSVTFTDEFALEGCDISGFFSGVGMGDVDDGRVVGNHIHHLRTTPIKGAGNRLVIEANELGHMTPYRYFDPALGKNMGDHLDFIHLYTSLGKGMKGVRIARNLLDAAGGFDALGIFLQDGSGAGLEAEVEDNTLFVANTQGITFSSTVVAKVHGNVLLAPPGSEKHPALIHRGATVEATGNTWSDTSAKPYNSVVFPENTYIKGDATAEQIEAAREVAMDRIAPTDWQARAKAAEARADQLQAANSDLERLLSQSGEEIGRLSRELSAIKVGLEERDILIANIRQLVALPAMG